MYGFDYHRPGSVADATSALGGADDGKYLAGGQTLLATMKQRLAAPSDLVDLGGIADLKGISVVVALSLLVPQQLTQKSRLQPMFRGPSRPLQHWLGILAIARSVMQEQLVARSPTMTRQQTIQLPFWLWVRRLPPISVKSLQMTSSRACSRRHWKKTRLLPRFHSRHRPQVLT